MSAVTQSQIVQYKSQCKELLLQGLNAHKVSLIVGCSPISVKNWFPELAVKNSKKLTEEQQKQIIELRKQHKSYSQIGLILNISNSTVSNYCNKYPELKVTKEEHTSFGRLTKEEVIKRLADKNYEYISGYVDYNSIITLKCNICGTVFSKKADYIVRVNNTLSHCPHCKEIRRQEQEQCRQKEQERKQIIKEFESLNNNYIREIKIAFNIATANLRKLKPYKCKNCGKQFVTTQPSSYCSEECKLYHKRYKDYLNSIQRKFKELNREEDVIDKDISLYKVIKRDKGICYLCNKPVDTNDYHITAKGAVAVGNNYPSIDHILPISKGGKHSWDNVGLAHLICNSHKSNNIIDKE